MGSFISITISLLRLAKSNMAYMTITPAIFGCLRTSSLNAIDDQSSSNLRHTQLDTRKVFLKRAGG